jgi:hypothetical protein
MGMKIKLTFQKKMIIVMIIPSNNHAMPISGNLKVSIYIKGAAE